MESRAFVLVAVTLLYACDGADEVVRQGICSPEGIPAGEPPCPVFQAPPRWAPEECVPTRTGVDPGSCCATYRCACPEQGIPLGDPRCPLFDPPPEGCVPIQTGVDAVTCCATYACAPT